jgi:phosphoserine phosphatase
MVVFDLDGTLTPVDSLWSYLHTAFGTMDRGMVIAQRYLNGEITYKEWAETDARSWAGTPLPKVMNVLGEIPYREGVREVFEELKKRGVKIVILTAGLSIMADKAAKELGADLSVANELHEDKGKLTGEIDVRVAVNNKEEIVRDIASKVKIALSEIALVGDRGFDLANKECLKIAFLPKDEIARRQADFIVENADFREILQYLC